MIDGRVQSLDLVYRRRRPTSSCSTTRIARSAIGERGEACARGPQVMPGALEAAANAAAFTTDGYFRAGLEAQYPVICVGALAPPYHVIVLGIDLKK